MAKHSVPLNDRQRDWLTRYWFWYDALARGDWVPATPAQRQFVKVCRGQGLPRTEHERAYHLGRRVVENCTSPVSALVRCGFRVPPGEMKDVEWPAGTVPPTRADERWVDTGRFRSKRRSDRRSNG